MSTEPVYVRVLDKQGQLVQVSTTIEQHPPSSSEDTINVVLNENIQTPQEKEIIQFLESEGIYTLGDLIKHIDIPF